LRIDHYYPAFYDWERTANANRVGLGYRDGKRTIAAAAAYVRILENTLNL